MLQLSRYICNKVHYDENVFVYITEKVMLARLIHSLIESATLMFVRQCST